MNKTGRERVEESIWGEIAGELERERGIKRCLCFGEEFRRKLTEAGLPFPLEGFPPSGGPGDGAELFLGWQVLAGERDLLDPEEIHSALRPGGEARIFGFYSAPRPEDLRERGERAARPEAVSLGRVAGWLKTGPFGRYTIRKRGIYYDCRLEKGD